MFGAYLVVIVSRVSRCVHPSLTTSLARSLFFQLHPFPEWKLCVDCKKDDQGIVTDPNQLEAAISTMKLHTDATAM